MSDHQMAPAVSIQSEPLRPPRQKAGVSSWTRWRRRKMPSASQADGPAAPETTEVQAGSEPDVTGPTAVGPAAEGITPPARRWSPKRKGLAGLLAVLLVALLAVNIGSLGGVLFPHRPAFYILSVDYTGAYADAASLCAIGPRLTGTIAEGQGAEYIETAMRNAGLTGVETQEYLVTCYEVDRASMSLVPYFKGLFPNPVTAPTAFEHKTEFTVGGYSGSRSYTRWSDDIEVADVGDGSDSSLYASVSGMAVIATNDGTLGNTQLYLQAWQAGAAASLIHNVAADAEIGYPAISYAADAVDEGGHTIPLPDNYTAGDGPNIPNLMVSKRAGDAIKDGIADQSRLRLDIAVTVEKRPCRVVVGEVRGSTEPDKLIMLGAHHDTAYNGPGAVDNTAGTAALLGIAREIGKLRPAKTVRFATFGGEEEGLLGSYEYYKAYASRLKGKLEMFLNFDMCNIDTSRSHSLPIVVSDRNYTKVLSGIKAEASAQLTQLSGYDISFYQGNLTSSSDMAPFALEHYKVASCWGSGCYEYHTTKDTIEHINPESFLVVGAIYGSFAYYLAGGRP